METSARSQTHTFKSGWHIVFLMSKLQKRISKIKDRIIREKFSELSKLEISLDLEKKTDELMGYGELVGGGYYIDVDTEMKKASNEAIYGGLAHELAHILIDEKKYFISRFFTDIIFELGTKYQKKDKKLNIINRWINNNIYHPCHSYVIKDERNTDLLVVEKNAGKELLAFLKFHDKYHDESDEGLTVIELEQILKQLY